MRFFRNSNRFSPLLANGGFRRLRKLRIEQLEQRLLLTVYNWTGGGVDSNFTTAANWTSQANADPLPGANDTGVTRTSLRRNVTI